MRDKTFFLIVFLLILVIAFVYTDIRKQEASIISDSVLKKSKIIPPFLLKQSDGNIVDFFSLTNSEITGVFVLPKPCLSCNPNFFFLEKLTKKYDKYFTPIWIVCNGQKIPEHFMSNSNSGYDIYFPIEPELFSLLFNVKFRLPRVTFLNGNEVIYSKLGELSDKDYFEISNFLRRQENE
jgi:hypothetical protein